jgi:hypothetical protein
MAVDREARAADLDVFASGGLIIPQPPQPVSKPLDVDVARAAANNLIVNVVNLNYEIREIVAAQGIQFHNADIEKQIALEGQGDPSVLSERGQKTIPTSLQNDFPASTKDFDAITILDDKRAVFISHAQRVEYRLRVVDTKEEFKKALETPGILVVYSGHSRFGRVPCFGPDIVMSLDQSGKLVRDFTGENWETGTDPDKFGLFRMGPPFVGVPFGEMDEHQYKMRPVPTTQTVNPADINKLTDHNSLKPVKLVGTRFESLIDDPVADTYWGCRIIDHGDGVLMFADFQNSKSKPLDLGATNLQCRCLTVLSCDSFSHFHEVVRKRKGFTRTDSEGFAYFMDSLYIKPVDRLYFGSMFEYNVRNDNKSWFPCLEFAVSQTNKKLVKMAPQFKLQLKMI